MHTSLTKPTVSYKEYDICVITAANEHQAQGYQEQLRWRINKGYLPEETEFLVVGKDSLCENLINANVQLDIYKDIPFAMLGKTVAVFSVPPQAASSVPSPSFTNALQKIPFFVYLLPFCEFFHIGTSKQLIQNFHTVNYTASAYGFQNFNKSKALDKSLGSAFVYNSLINTVSKKQAIRPLLRAATLKDKSN